MANKQTEDGYDGYEPGQWRMAPKRYTLFLSYEASHFLAYLIDTAIGLSLTDKYDGWFYCTVLRVHIETRLSRRQQTRLLAELAEACIIKLEYRGRGALRYIRIDRKAIRWWLNKTSHIETKYPGCKKFVKFDKDAALAELKRMGKAMTPLRDQYVKSRLRKIIEDCI